MWRIIRFVVVESQKRLLVFSPFFFEHRTVASLFFFERSQTQERVGKILLNYIFYKRVYDDVNDDVNESDDKNDGRQTKCVYLLFRFFCFKFFFFFSSFKSENKRTSY